MVDVFREVRRVLRKDGTLWLNLGDSYSSGGRETYGTWAPDSKQATHTAIKSAPRAREQDGIKPKDLIGMPWRIAFALQADGWYLRQDIIWSKPNPMPESVTDRCTKSHEYIFLLSKSERYYYDAAAIRDAPSGRTDAIRSFGNNPNRNDGNSEGWSLDGSVGRNKRSVWEVTTQPFSEAHFATFPPALIEPCIKAGTSSMGCCGECGTPFRRLNETTPSAATSETKGTKAANSPRNDGDGWNSNNGRGFPQKKITMIGWEPACVCNSSSVKVCTVLDPFAGAGTTGLVADRLQRNAILIELNPNYADMSERRIVGDAPLFVEVLHARRPDGRSSER